MALTAYYRDRVVNHMLRGEEFAVPTRLFAGLLDASVPAQEVQAREYARQTVVFRVPEQAGVTRSENRIEFPQATDAWGEVVAVGIYDSLEGGRMLAVCELDDRYEIVKGAQFRLPAGMVRFSIR